MEEINDNSNNERQQQQPLLPCAEELSRQLWRQRITRGGFSLPLTVEEAYLLVYRAYAVEVSLRGGTLHADEHTTAAVAQVAKALARPDQMRTGLLLCGTPGNGKSTMLRAVQNAVNWLDNRGRFPIERRDRGLNRLAIVEAKALAAADEREQNRVALTPVLGLEDMGAEAAETLRFGNVVTPVADLIEKRYTARRYTIVTTNLTPGEIRSRYGARVADRLNEMMQVVIFRSASYRR